MDNAKPKREDIWDHENTVPESTISCVDNAILDKMPKDTQIVQISPSAASYTAPPVWGAVYWARTAKIETLNAEGETVNYFVKIRNGPDGKNGYQAEFLGMSALHKVMPNLIARPIAWGKLESFDDTYFLLLSFYELRDKIPEPASLMKMIAELHRKGVAADGKFGMPWDVYGGDGAWQPYKPADTWEECFSYMLEVTFGYEIKTQGPDRETEDMYKAILDKVVPRLLRRLEEDGRKVLPCLCHGDLWDGNCSVDVNTGLPVIFDAIPLYSHNEFEMSAIKVPFFKMQQAYIDEYVKFYPESEPVEEFDDRLWLYFLYFNVRSSSAYVGSDRYRIMDQNCMRRLIEKYGEGWEGYLARKNSDADEMNSEISAMSLDPAFPDPKGVVGDGTGLQHK